MNTWPIIAERLRVSQEKDAELARLRAENERLKAAVASACKYLRVFEQLDEYGEELDATLRAALHPTDTEARDDQR